MAVLLFVNTDIFSIIFIIACFEKSGSIWFLIQVDQFTSPDIFLKHQISIHLVPYQEALKHFLLKLPLTGDLLLPYYAGPEKIIFWIIDFTLHRLLYCYVRLLPQIDFIQ